MTIPEELRREIVCAKINVRLARGFTQVPHSEVADVDD